MKEILENGKYTALNEKGEILCVIESLGDDTYRATNKSLQIIAEIKPIDDYITYTRCIENKNADKNGRFRKSKKLAEHNTRWLSYMLEEKGLIRKSKAFN